MPTPTERKALLFLGAVACLGGGVRILRARQIPPPPVAARRALDAQISAVGAAAGARTAAPATGRPRPPGKARAGRAGKADRPPAAAPAPAAADRPGRAGRSGPGKPRKAGLPPAPPLGPFNRLDVDRAPASELQRLPGIGPALAARIMAYRDSNGPFGSLDRLRRVRGIGPATVARLDSLVRFSGLRAP